MIEVGRLTLLIAGEILVGLTLLSSILVGMLVVKKGKIRKAAKHLVDRIQGDKETRSERLRARLAEQYLYAGEKLEQALHDLTQAEMRLYQNIINSYLKQDVVEFQQTDVEVENLVLAYQGLELPEVAVAEPVEGEGNADESAEIQRLKEENERLYDELRVTMDTMGRMLNEYSSMFAGGADNEMDKEQLKEMLEEKDSDSSNAVAESGSGDPPTADMTQTDIDDLVEPLSQLEDLELIVDVGEPEAAAPDVAMDETLDELEMLEEDVDAGATELSVDQQAVVENSLVDDLESVDIEIPEVDEIDDDAQAEPESLEDEWAKLLAEDAESPESTEGEMEADINNKQSSV